jgi:signal transduction histidine kinase
MHIEHSISPTTTPTTQGSERALIVLHVFAALTLAAIILSLLLFWPIPQLGLSIDLASGMVASVDAESPAARSGIQPGDRVTNIYSYAWSAIEQQWLLFPLAWGEVRSIPIHFEHTGVSQSLQLPVDPPQFIFQLEKLSAFALGFVYWIVGYLLGVVRRESASGSRLLAWFWMGLGAIVGSYTFVSYGSYPIKAILLWLLLTVMVPIAGYTHVGFPTRPVKERHARLAKQILVGTLIGLQLIFWLALLIWKPALVDLIDGLILAVTTALMLVCAIAGLILWSTYQASSVAPIRRQIRIMATAVLITGLSWALLRSLPLLFGQALPIPHYLIDLVSCLIPLAYLACGIIPDLDRIDRFLMRLLPHMLAIFLLGGAAAIVVGLFQLAEPERAAWFALSFVTLYRPAYAVARRLLPANTQRAQAQMQLEQTATALASTLDAKRQIDALCYGVRAAFDAPPVAFYHVSQTDENIRADDDLMLVTAGGLELPRVLGPGALRNCLQQSPGITTSRTIYPAVRGMDLSPTEAAIVHHPGIMLWCSIRHAHGYLLGLLLIGVRGDLDPYRPKDLRELQRLADAAALALTNSATYTALIRSEETLRALYHRYQAVQMKTAASIAHEIHDEVINVLIHMNVRSLERMIETTSDLSLREDLKAILESEQGTAQFLRLICENLYPSGLNDPMGLPAALRRQIERIQSFWNGTCHFVVEHTPCGITAHVQWQVIRVVREALMNVFKHARATELTLTLSYPSAEQPTFRVEVSDNGGGASTHAQKSTQFGMRLMRDCAEALDGSLTLQPRTEGGSRLLFTWPAQLKERLP